MPRNPDEEWDDLKAISREMRAETTYVRPAAIGLESSAGEKRAHRGKGRKCWATKRNGERCTNYAEFGVRVCRMHGANSPKAKMAAGRREALKETKQLVGRLGVPVEADPRAVLLEQVYSAYGMQQALGALLQQYDAVDLADDDPQIRMRLRSVTNLYGFWSEKAAQFSALAVRAGIEERLVKLAESQAMTVVQVLRGALSRVTLSPEQERELLAACAAEIRALMPGGASQREGEPAATDQL